MIFFTQRNIASVIVSFLVCLLISCKHQDNLTNLGEPIACFSIENINCGGFAPAEIFITNCSENANKFRWIWGDNTASLERDPGSHIFKDPGIYNIQLIVEDELGNTSDTTLSITITQPVTGKRKYGGAGSQRGTSIINTSDNNFLVVGSTTNRGVGGYDIWVLKIDQQGNIIWDNTYGKIDNDFGYDVVEIQDNGFVILGSLYDENSNFLVDVWLIKINSNGDILWHKNYGTPYEEGGRSLIETSDGGLAVLGYKYSQRGYDFWLIKTDNEGNKLWDKEFGGALHDFPSEIIESDDKGLVLIGNTLNKGAGGSDVWMIKTDKNGNLLWDKTFGGIQNEDGKGITQTSDGGFAIIGSNSSKGNGYNDIWWIRTNDIGNVIWDKTYGGNRGDYGTDILITGNSENFIVLGYSNSVWSSIVNSDIWLQLINPNGEVIWQETFGEGYLDELGFSIVNTSNCGLVFVGTVSGDIDLLLIQTDNNGKLW